MTTTFDALPDTARLWVFTLSRALADAEETALVGAMQPFVEGWESHRRPVEAAFAVAEKHFVIVAAQIPGGDVSGCGIDALVRQLEATLARLGVPLAAGMDVALRGQDGRVQVVDRPTLKGGLREGSVGAETPVFDASITTLGAWRSGAFVKPLGQTWAARYLVPAPL